MSLTLRLANLEGRSRVTSTFPIVAARINAVLFVLSVASISAFQVISICPLNVAQCNGVHSILTFDLQLAPYLTAAQSHKLGLSNVCLGR